MAVAKSKPSAPKTAATPPVAKLVAPAIPVAAAPSVARPAVAKSATRRAIDSETRARMIAEAAYYIAEKRGFIHGHHDQDWAQAEREIDALLTR